MAQALELRKLRHVPDSPPASPPLSFSRWFARRARGCDLLLLLLELLTVNTMHVSQLMFARVCVPVGGGPHAALQELPLEPAAHRADALLAAFPCGASHAGRLLYVLRTAAVVDPRVALRLTDYSNVARILGQLAVLAITLACPRLYERTRHGLFFALNAAVLLGCCASAAWTPAPLLPMVSATFLTAGRRRMGAVYFGWKAATVYRVPSSLQLLFGPALWLLAITATPLVDRRLLPYGDSQPQHLQASHAALLFVVMAVLPYLASRYVEHTSLRPQYRAYLLGRRGMGGGGSEVSSRSASKEGSTAGGSCSGDNAPAAGGGGGGGGGAGHSAGSCEGFSSSGCVARRPSPVSEARMIQPLSTGNLARLLGPRAWAGAPGGAAAAVPAQSLPPGSSRALLYRSRQRGAYRVLLLSVKVMLPGDGHTSGSPSFKETAALAQNAAIAALRVHHAAASGGGGSSGSGQPALLQPGAGAARFFLTSALCVEGCVHLLVMVRREGGGSNGSGGIYHFRIEKDAASAGIAAAVESAMQQLLMEAAAGANAVPLAPSAFAWPPALPTTAAAGGGAASNVRSSSNRREAQHARASEVLLLLPAALLRKLRAVRCVVAGPSAEPQRQAVHLDVTMGGAGATACSESEGGCAALRLQLPPAALRGPGTLTIFVLPPSPADTAPLAAFPLLVLPAAAVAEVRQLYGEVLGQKVYDSLEQQLLLGGMVRGGSGGPDSWSPAASASAAAASASAAIQQGGLVSLLYDMGALLELPANGGEEAPGGGAASGGADSQALAQQLLLEAASFADLLRFLASQRMGACLREGLRALRRAGVQLGRDGEALGSRGGHGAVEAAALQMVRQAGEAEEMGPTGANGQPAAPQPAAQQTSSSIGPRPGVRLPRGALAGWLRVLLLGFSPPGQERSYQAFKAAQCCRINLMYFAVLPLVRLATCLRTLRAVQAESAPVPSADGIGAGRLSALQQQLLAQAVFTAAAFLSAVLAFGTPLLHRGRTALLLTFKAVLDPLTFLLILWPPEWGGPLLRTPEAWLDADRRFGVHWLHQSVLEPALIQLSPRHQLWPALANLLPMTLLGLQVYRGHWAHAMRFGAGDAALGLAVSVATDLTTRQLFVRQRPRHTGKAD